MFERVSTDVVNYGEGCSCLLVVFGTVGFCLFFPKFTIPVICFYLFLLVVFAITLLFFLFKGIWWGKGFQNFK